MRFSGYFFKFFNAVQIISRERELYGMNSTHCISYKVKTHCITMKMHQELRRLVRQLLINSYSLENCKQSPHNSFAVHTLMLSHFRH